MTMTAAHRLSLSKRSLTRQNRICLSLIAPTTLRDGLSPTERSDILSFQSRLSSSQVRTSSTTMRNIAFFNPASWSMARSGHQIQNRTFSAREREPFPPDTFDSKNTDGTNDIASALDAPRMSLLMELTDRVGILHEVLRYFWKYDINISRIESRLVQIEKGVPRFDFFVDMIGSQDDDRVSALLKSLVPSTNKLLILDHKEVDWFPRHISELDLIANRTLQAGTDLESDHPGFSDQVYRNRRATLAQAAIDHTWDAPIPSINYSNEELSVWEAVWDRMESIWEKYACRDYIQAMERMKRHCGYSRDSIPQQQDVSEFLQQQTGFRLRPVAGLLSSRDFLNGLAFRVFFSTQYIRHASQPLHTPEPDICHELLGHAPMFADSDFADFSQEIGLASLGASNDEIERLARCYWHSVEFGLCKENGKVKAYGAALLSSFGELEYACNSNVAVQEEDGNSAEQPTLLPWDPAVASKQAFPITTYQPVYFLAESLQDAKQKIRQYCEDLPRPFFCLYNEQTNTVHIDRPVRRTKGAPESGMGTK